MGPRHPASPVSGSKAALRAFDLRTGAPRWIEAVPDGCVPEQVAAGEQQVVAVLACARTELRLAAFDPADGRQRRTAPLGGRTTPVPDGQVTLRSAEPAVVQTGGTTEGRPGAFLAFGAGGKATGRVETTGGYATVPARGPRRTAGSPCTRASEGSATVLAITRAG
ncbi:hypothetical protein [Streptomyces sp. NPDC091371]|uniref:hypothetical protein n=1 Tax=Streptomyces sp. NPDC091371 TaxID=3155303 RepID=UPI00343C125B